MPGHLLEFGRQFHAADLLEQMAGHVLKKVDDIILFNE